MMINSILDRELTLCKVQGSSKKRVLENIAEFIHQHHQNIDADELFRQLTARERLGSTGIGHGIAIPHCRSNQVQSAIACLVTLKEPIDFDAHDDAPVDIIFVLIAPENASDEHLNILAGLAGLMNQTDFRNNLRKSTSSDELYNAAARLDLAA